MTTLNLQAMDCTAQITDPVTTTVTFTCAPDVTVEVVSAAQMVSPIIAIIALLLFGLAALWHWAFA